MNKQNNVANSGSQTSWEDKWGINAGSLTNATRATLKCEVKSHPNGDFAVLHYSGSSALTIAEYANLPKGSEIICSGLTTKVRYLKYEAAETDGWVKNEYASI